MAWQWKFLHSGAILTIFTLMHNVDGNSNTKTDAARGSGNYSWSDVATTSFRKCKNESWPYFFCSNGNCFSYQQACDGHDDCGDSTDECRSMCSQTFHCVTSGKCLAMDKFCDGVRDCEDGSDELPPDGGFACTNAWLKVLEDGSGAHWKERRVAYNVKARSLFLEQNATTRMCRLPHQYVCDGINHCGDHSDECSAGCRSKNKRFECGNRQCISLKSKCDRRDDCGDASDEMCHSSTFICNNEERIPFSQFCDGSRDCSDGSDELRPQASTHLLNSNETISCSNIYNFHDMRCLLPRKYHCDGTEQCVLREDECTNNCSYSFMCNNGQCLLSNKKCDGRVDCLDLSDECGGFPCGKSLSCNNGSCLPQDHFCDGVKHCADGEDEIEESQEGMVCEMADKMRSDGFHYCSNAFSRINKRIDATLSPRTCRLPSWHVCDGVGHCENRTDECVKGCDRSFSCDGGENCVAKSGLCDGHASCSDLADEPGMKYKSLENARGFKCLFPAEHTTNECVLPQQFVADGTIDCLDHSDQCKEEIHGKNVSTCVHCVTTPNIRILKKQICDGVFDCPDLSDECFCYDVRNARLCASFCPLTKAPDCHCAVGMVPCLTENSTFDDSALPQCIPIDQFCNGVKDCANAADELYCKPGDDAMVTNTNIIPCKRFLPGNSYAPEFATACDFIPECADMEDECDQACHGEKPGYCKHRSHIGYFTCSSFMPSKFVCNGVVNCHGLEDELYCNKTRVKCHSGKVYSIERKRWCDYRIDCEDASDELYCDSSTHFYCEDKQSSPRFVRERQMFDGTNDCSDGSDECPRKWEDASIFSSREYLIKSVFLRVMIWIMGLLAVGGNLLVVAQTLKVLCTSMRRKLNKVAVIYKVLVLNLAMADLLMGAFLIGLGVESVRTSGKYCQQDHVWRSGFTCSSLGVLAVLSSEVSLLILTILSTYRSYCVVRPVKSRALNVHTTVLIITVTWFFGFIVALLPFTSSLQEYFVSEMWISPNPYFSSDVVSKASLNEFYRIFSHYSSGSHPVNATVEWRQAGEILRRLNPDYKVLGFYGFYSRHATCLPKIFVTRRDPGWQYSIVLTVFNCLLCLYIVVAYCLICRPRQVNKTTVMNQGTRNMQKKIAILVASDCACWLPICLTAFLWFAEVPVSHTAYAVTAVILLPINSALNPLFYSDAVQGMYKELKTIVNKICMRNRHCSIFCCGPRIQRGNAVSLSTNGCDSRLIEAGDSAFSAVYRSDSRTHTEHTYVEGAMAESVI